MDCVLDRWRGWMLEHWEDDMDNWGTDSEPGGRTPLGDLIAVHTAASVDDLWRALVTDPGLRGGQSFEAVGLFKQHHGHGDADALHTALLLCTGPALGSR